MARKPKKETDIAKLVNEADEKITDSKEGFPTITELLDITVWEKYVKHLIKEYGKQMYPQEAQEAQTIYNYYFYAGTAGTAANVTQKIQNRLKTKIRKNKGIFEILKIIKENYDLKDVFKNASHQFPNINIKKPQEANSFKITTCACAAVAAGGARRKMRGGATNNAVVATHVFIHLVIAVGTYLFLYYYLWVGNLETVDCFAWYSFVASKLLRTPVQNAYCRALKGFVNLFENFFTSLNNAGTLAQKLQFLLFGATIMGSVSAGLYKVVKFYDQLIFYLVRMILKLPNEPQNIAKQSLFVTFIDLLNTFFTEPAQVAQIKTRLGPTIAFLTAIGTIGNSERVNSVGLLPFMPKPAAAQQPVASEEQKLPTPEEEQALEDELFGSDREQEGGAAKPKPKAKPKAKRTPKKLK